ncbi:MAG TPA: hypothetical protein VMW25_05580 [Clostridia bacterium]|nr:hypothetical protein [Clostridia bacterium]
MLIEAEKLIEQLAQIGEDEVQKRPIFEAISQGIVSAMKAGDIRERQELLDLYDAYPNGIPENEDDKGRLITDIQEAASLLNIAFKNAGINAVVLMLSEKGITVAPKERKPSKPEKAKTPKKVQHLETVPLIKVSDLTPRDEIVLCGLFLRKGVLEEIRKEIFPQGFETAINREYLPAGKKWKDTLEESRQGAAKANNNQEISADQERESLELIKAFIKRINSKSGKRGWHQIPKNYKAFILLREIISLNRNRRSKVDLLTDILEATQLKAPNITTNSRGEVLLGNEGPSTT